MARGYDESPGRGPLAEDHLLSSSACESFEVESVHSFSALVLEAERKFRSAQAENLVTPQWAMRREVLSLGELPLRPPAADCSWEGSQWSNASSVKFLLDRM
jgi:hypothetical protein